MKLLKLSFLAILIGTFISCTANHASNNGSSTPIDSTNTKGSPPATYGANDPARDKDSNRTNVNDTGTKANNVHNTGYDSVKK
ncbi:MAG TPA: hypothetical protein VN721_09695 [Flavipsychrobacter sp.]|nr:hypothetical protein [Flavipsychrobacter sp.]